MKYSLRLPFAVGGLLLSLLIGGAGPARAQQSGLLPLLSDPARARHAPAPTAQRTNLLTLPFFEDFAGQPEGPPNATRWETAGGVLVNERFALAPPSRGMATFDGLNAAGQAYGGLNTNNFTDVLTSQPIDLSGVGAGDRTFLSFFWQAGTIALPASTPTSSRPVYLELQFLDNAGSWVRVWRRNSPENGQRTDFIQRFIAINEARFLHAGFKFRFRSFGRQYGVVDAWNLDYLVLDRNRDTTNVNYADVVLSAPLSSLLERYSSMPYWQYNAAANPSQELSSSVTTTANNLDAPQLPATPFTYRGVLRVLPSGAEQQFLTGNVTLPAGNRQFAIAGSARTTTLSIPMAPTRVQHRVNISLLSQVTDPRKAANDTVRRITEFGDYFAYDDGTPEATVSLRQGTVLPTARAMRFDLNRNDQVSSLRYYYAGATVGNGGTLPASVTVTFAVWDVGTDGKPAGPPRATSVVVLPTNVTTPEFRTVSFSAPVPVSGSFFVGYIQPATQLFVQFGADLNSRQPQNTFYDSENNAWTVALNVPGLNQVPMIRPVMTGVVTGLRNAAANAAVQVYPNPSPGRLHVQGRYRQAVALDALGRLVWQQPAAQAGQAELDLRGLPGGVYLLRLTLPDGAVSTQRVVLQP